MYSYRAPLHDIRFVVHEVLDFEQHYRAYGREDLNRELLEGILEEGARFAEDVLAPTAIESTAIESAGLAKRSLYELEPGNVGRDTFRRAKDSMDAVNDRILELIRQSWGRV